MDNYYDYENDILKRLSEIFKFDSISVYQDNYNYDYYNNQPITLSTYDDKYLILNFRSINWHYSFNRNIILDAFNDNVPVRKVVNQIVSDIEYDWMKVIKK